MRSVPCMFNPGVPQEEADDLPDNEEVREDGDEELCGDMAELNMF